MYDDLDSLGDDGLDSDLFGSPPVEDVFQLPGVDTEVDGEPTDSIVSRPAGDTPSGTIGALSYDRGDNEVVGRPTEIDGDNLDWNARRSRGDRELADRRANRQRAGAGDRNIGRAARQHPSNTGTGERRGSAPAASLADAASRLRSTVATDERAGSNDPVSVDSGVETFIKQSMAGRAPRGPSADPLKAERAKKKFERKTSQALPSMDTVDFEAEVYGLKMTAAGDWLLTMKVPWRYRESLAGFGAIAGMNLRVHMDVDGIAT